MPSAIIVRKFVRYIRSHLNTLLAATKKPQLADKAPANEHITGTEYFDSVDPQRLAALMPYKAVASEQSYATTQANININFFLAYGPKFKEKTAAHISIDPPWYYYDLLTRISAIENVEFKTCKDALAQKPMGNQIICSIRHDVDGDLVAAKQQAEIEHALGISTSFYLLHNAPYYGNVIKSELNNETILQRHETSLDTYKEIQVLGHELAIHTDPMDFYQRLNTDGAAAFETELAWLRNNEINIFGTTAHNSFSVYGCNNYSIFKNRPLAMSIPSGPKAVLHNGYWAPLQMIDEQSLGLKYEANDFFWQDETPVLYGCLMTQNNWYIAENQYGSLSPDTASERPALKVRYGTHNDMIDAIKNLTGPAYVKLVVHPMHYGLRESEYSEPWLANESGEKATKKYHRWAGGLSNGGIAGSAITYVNEFDTPDRGLDCYLSGDFKIAVLGGTNTNTYRVNADSKFPQVAARLVRGPLAKPTAIAISAATNISFSAQKAINDLERIKTAATPDTVVLEIGALCVNNNELIELINSIHQSYELIIIVSTSDKESIVTDRVNIVQINPTQAFNQYVGSGLLYWEDEDTWAPQAHFLVAKSVSEAIVKFFKG